MKNSESSISWNTKFYVLLASMMAVFTFISTEGEYALAAGSIIILLIVLIIDLFAVISHKYHKVWRIIKIIIAIILTLLLLIG